MWNLPKLFVGSNSSRNQDVDSSSLGDERIIKYQFPKKLAIPVERIDERVAANLKILEDAIIKMENLDNEFKLAELDEAAFRAARTDLVFALTMRRMDKDFPFSNQEVRVILDASDELRILVNDIHSIKAVEKDES